MPADIPSVSHRTGNKLYKTILNHYRIKNQETLLQYLGKTLILLNARKWIKKKSTIYYGFLIISLPK